MEARAHGPSAPRSTFSRALEDGVVAEGRAARRRPRRRAVLRRGYRTGASGVEPAARSPRRSSPTTGTTSSSRARVAATYAQPVASSRRGAASRRGDRAAPAAPQPASGIAQSLRCGSTCATARACVACAVGSTRMTTGNSRPLALCTVMIRTPSVPSSTTGASAAPPRSASSSRRATNARNDVAPVALEAARHVEHAEHVRERLLARRPDRDAGVRARRLEQPRDTCRRWAGGCGRRAGAEDRERVGDGLA